MTMESLSESLSTGVVYGGLALFAFGCAEALKSIGKIRDMGPWGRKALAAFFVVAPALLLGCDAGWELGTKAFGFLIVLIGGCYFVGAHERGVEDMRKIELENQIRSKIAEEERQRAESAVTPSQP